MLIRYYSGKWNDKATRHFHGFGWYCNEFLPKKTTNAPKNIRSANFRSKYHTPRRRRYATTHNTSNAVALSPARTARHQRHCLHRRTFDKEPWKGRSFKCIADIDTEGSRFASVWVKLKVAYDRRRRLHQLVNVHELRVIKYAIFSYFITRILDVQSLMRSGYFHLNFVPTYAFAVISWFGFVNVASFCQVIIPHVHAFVFDRFFRTVLGVGVIFFQGDRRVDGKRSSI